MARSSAASLSLTFALGVDDRGDHRVSQLVGGLQACLLYARLPVDPEADLLSRIRRNQHKNETSTKSCMENMHAVNRFGHAGTAVGCLLQNRATIYVKIKQPKT